VAATVALAVTSVAAVATDAAPVRVAAAATSLGLFAAGVVTFFVAYAIAVNRSRTDSIGIGGLFFLAGADTTANATHKRVLQAALAAQTAIAIATAAARPFTSLAFGVLAPLSALSLTGLYGARHGRFPPRTR
jgi:hypothetical protein